MSADCVFCRIVSGELPAQLIASTDTAIVIVDREPKAPIHWLVIPREHVEDLRSPRAQDPAFIAPIMEAAQSVIKLHAANQPFRLVINNGFEAGQRVFHLHMHILMGLLSE